MNDHEILVKMAELLERIDVAEFTHVELTLANLLAQAGLLVRVGESYCVKT